MNAIVPNSSPHIGVIAVFAYPIPHLAYVEKLTDEGFIVKEANYEPAKIGERLVKWNDPHLKGFWKPPDIALR